MAEQFIRCWHPEVEGEALFAKSSLPHQMRKGWAPVEPDPVDEPEPEPEPKPKPKAKKTKSLDE